MDIRQKLHEYYLKQGIAVPDFHCKNEADCVKAVHGALLWHGSEAHVGAHYGEPFRLVIVSLDRGDGSDDVWQRSACIEGLYPPGPNPHMRGTFATLAAVLPAVERTQDLWKHFAMTNAAKCCHKKQGMQAVPQSLYDRCSEYTFGELAVLDPQLVITQGNCAKSVLMSISRPIEIELRNQLVRAHRDPIATRTMNTQEIIQRYISWIDIGGKCVPWLHTCHPSTWQGGLWQKYLKEVLPTASLIVLDLVNTLSQEQ